MASASLLAELIALVAPPVCATCHHGVMAADEAMCPDCRQALPWLTGPRCRRCGLPAPCRPCPAAGAAFQSAWAPLAYAGTARTAIIRLKFAGALALGDVMAAHIAANAPPTMLAQATLVAVPLHRARRRVRGYDQSRLLSRALSRRTGLPISRCLVRRGRPSRQVGAGRRARLARGRIDVVAIGPVPERVVLVDDVHTTGATFEACARALRHAGTREIACVAYARALPG